ncbi:hypothetical protein [Actinoplanes sp. NPDC026619]|uniref:Rv0361 family membrane protein n=1 Tax=Actinoplanes sp. NPDC026619 TaxID=3155798 RepID=UPI0033E1E57F
MATPAWQPMPPPPPPPPPKRSNTLRTVLIVVGVVLVLCCAGGVIGGVFLYKGVKTAVGPVRDVADEFITDLEHDDTTSAYELLCSDTQNAFPPATFARGVSSQAKIDSHKITNTMIRNTNGSTSATVVASLTMSTGFVDQHTFVLIKESGTWKVCGNPY